MLYFTCIEEHLCVPYSKFQSLKESLHGTEHRCICTSQRYERYLQSTWFLAIYHVILRSIYIDICAQRVERSLQLCLWCLHDINEHTHAIVNDSKNFYILSHCLTWYFTTYWGAYIHTLPLLFLAISLKVFTLNEVPTSSHDISHHKPLL